MRLERFGMGKLDNQSDASYKEIDIAFRTQITVFMVREDYLRVATPDYSPPIDYWLVVDTPSCETHITFGFWFERTRSLSGQC